MGNKTPSDKDIYYFNSEFNFSEKLILHNDNTFLFKARDICNSDDYLGKWTKKDDTIILHVLQPDIYSTKLKYKVIERENDSIRYIKVTGLYDEIGFVGFVHENENQEEFVMGDSKSFIFKVNPDNLIHKLTINGGPPYPSFDIDINPPSRKSLEITISSYPKTYCKIPEKNKWLVRNDTLILIKSNKLEKDHFLVLEQRSDK